MRDVIQNVVSKITETAIKENVFVTDAENLFLPNRGEIIGIIKDLRQVIFPGYFDQGDFSSSIPDYYFGSMLDSIYQRLHVQVETAFLYDDKGKSDKAVISEKADAICEAFISKIPEIQQMLLMDIQASYDGDPAAGSKEDIIFSYPGLFAIYVYRLAHELYQAKVPFIPRIMTEYAHGKTGIDINPGATIGKYFCIDHGTGIVIGETTLIGDNVKLYQGVTLGALSTRKGHALSEVKRHPTICDYVTIYANATILGGDTVIGEDSVIGGNTFITDAIPPHSRVALKEAEYSVRTTKPEKSEDAIWDYVI